MQRYRSIETARRYHRDVGDNATKSLSPARLAHARKFIQAIVDRDFKKEPTSAARAWKVAQSSFSEFLKSKAGVGVKVLEAAADHARVPIDVVIGRSAIATRPTLAALPGWPESIAGVAPETLALAGATVPPAPLEKADERLALDYARAWEDAERRGLVARAGGLDVVTEGGPVGQAEEPPPRGGVKRTISRSDENNLGLAASDNATNAKPPKGPRGKGGKRSVVSG